MTREERIASFRQRHYVNPPNEPRDLVCWVPSILDCTVENLAHPLSVGHDYVCTHPNAGDDSSAVNGFDAMYGYGETPQAAYGAMLVELSKWQMERQLERTLAEQRNDTPDILERYKARMED